MTSAENTLTLVSKAHARVSRAVKSWQSASLPRVDDCHQTLEATVDDLRRVESILNACSSADLRDFQTFTPAIQSQLLAIKRDIVRLEKVVDASSAFLRGAALFTGPVLQTYGPTGHLNRAMVVADRGTEG